MANKNSRNNKFLFDNRDSVSPKIYSLMIKLVNDDREDLAKEVRKVDYLLEYASSCVRSKDYIQARETLNTAKDRISYLDKEGVDIEYIQYLYNGIVKKVK